MALDKVIDSAILDAGLEQIADEIREKGGTTEALSFPQAMADAIAAIETGATVETGTVTFDGSIGGYTFVDGEPDIFICYVDPSISGNYQHSGLKYLWCFIQDTREAGSVAKGFQTCFIGYNSGTQKYYACYSGVCTKRGRFANGDFNSMLAAATYRWFAIWGVNVQ